MAHKELSIIKRNPILAVALLASAAVPTCFAGVITTMSTESVSAGDTGAPCSYSAATGPLYCQALGTLNGGARAASDVEFSSNGLFVSASANDDGLGAVAASASAMAASSFLFDGTSPTDFVLTLHYIMLGASPFDQLAVNLNGKSQTVNSGQGNLSLDAVVNPGDTVSWRISVASECQPGTR